MTGLNAKVFGGLKNSSQAQKTISRLTSAGFSKLDISLLSTLLDGYLEGLRIPRYKAERLEGLVKDGCVLLSVHCVNSLEVDRANIILTQNGAQEIFSTGEQVSETPGMQQH